jgi:uncharacterized protein (TIGR03382 family)
VEQTLDFSSLPSDPEGPPGTMEEQVSEPPAQDVGQPQAQEMGQPQGCGASASGGMPMVAAVALLGTALLTRRRHALAQARSRSRR